MDLVSFRELYGFLTGEKLAEIAGAAGRRRRPATSAARTPRRSCSATRAPAARRRAGRRAGSTATATPGVAPVDARSGRVAGRHAAARGPGQAGSTPPNELEQRRGAERRRHPQGPRARSPRPSRPIEAQGERRRAAAQGDLLAEGGRPHRPVRRRCARIVLYIAVLIIFIVALVIINNALVMATLERVREIGTLRAIGAQRRFILAMLVIESRGDRARLRRRWAPALGAVAGQRDRQGRHPRRVNDVWFFFFSGPRLHPFLGAGNVDRRVRHRPAGERALQLLPGLARDARDARARPCRTEE